MLFIISTLTLTSCSEDQSSTVSFGPQNKQAEDDTTRSDQDSTLDTAQPSDSGQVGQTDTSDTASLSQGEPSNDDELECYELDGTPKPCEGVADSGAPNQAAEDCYDEQGLLIPCLGQEDDSELIFDGTIMLTELMLNPTGNNSLGQWIEIFIKLPIDPEGSEIPTNLENLTVSNGTSSFSFPSLWVDHSGFFVLGRNSDSASNGEVSVDYEYHGVLLSTISEEAYIELSLSNQLLDELSYGQFPAAQNLNEGYSLQLFPGVDHPDLNNNEQMWCAATAPMGQANFGTPGTNNSLCPMDP